MPLFHIFTVEAGTPFYTPTPFPVAFTILLVAIGLAAITSSISVVSEYASRERHIVPEDNLIDGF